MAKPVTIGDKKFPTQKSVTEFFHERFDHYATDDDFVPWVGEDAKLMAAFLPHNEKWRPRFAKWQLGQERCKKHWRPAVCFGGSDVRMYFGLPATLAMITMTPEARQRKKNHRILRATISYSHAVHKQKVFDENDKVICPHDGIELTFDTADVDHANKRPFVDIADEFIALLRANDMMFDDSHTTRDVNDALVLVGDHVAAWKQFHDDESTLEIISKNANQSKGHREAPKAIKDRKNGS